MNAAELDRILADWGDEVAERCGELEASLKGRRGPAAAVPIYAVLVALVYLAVTRRPCHLKEAWRALTQASQAQRRRLGLARVPSYRQVTYSLARLQRWAQDDDADGSDRLQLLLDLVVPASAGPDNGQTMLAVDTTLFSAWCRPVKAGETAADPDASGRIIDRGNGKVERYYGYAAVAGVRCDGTGPEVCERLTLLSAGEDDAEAGARLAISAAAAGSPITRVVADRGFSQKPERFQALLRSAGLHVTFDLKSNDLGRTGSYRGADVIDGWLYSPGMPKRLHHVPRPGVSATPAEKERFAKAMAQRARWAFPAHAAPEAQRVRVASPAKRGRIRCEAVPATLTNGDPAAPTCRVKHRPGEGCTIGTTYFGADANPRTYQYPAWGSADWAAIYSRRSAVERWFGHLQSDNGVGFRRGRFQLRRITKVAVVTAAATVATNLRLRWNHTPN